MSNSFKPSIIVAQLSLAGVMFLSATPAHAVCCVFDSMSIVRAIMSQTATLSTAITGSSAQSTLAITAAIKGAELASASSNREAAAMVSAAVVRTQAVADRTIQEDRYRLTNPCSVAAATVMTQGQMQAGGASVLAGSVGRSGGMGGVPAARGGASASMKAALDVASGGVPAPAPEIASQQGAKGACETFAASGTQRAAQCSAAGLAPSASSGLPNADIRADTLLDGPQGTTPRKRYSVDMDPSSPDRTAVDAYLRNLNTPLSLRELKPGEASTDEGRRYLDLRNSYDARVAMGERPARRQIARMAMTTTNIPYLKTLMSGDDAAWVGQYLAANAPAWQSKGVSADEVANIEVYRRFGNANWHKRMLETSPEERQREHLEITAFQSQLMWQLLQEVRELNVVNGANVLAAVRTEMVPQLNAQHAKAAR